MTRPNVLLIICDDLRADALGCYGQPGDPSSAIDGLARSGIRFDDCHCPAPLCNPARTALFTGIHPSRSGVYGNDHWWRPALPGVATLPEQFRNAGYRTAGFGKIFHHTDGFQPPDVWDHFEPIRFEDPWDRRVRSNYPSAPDMPEPDWFPANGISLRCHEFDWGCPPIPESEFSDARTAVLAAEAIRDSDPAHPFFIAAGFFRPHLPLYSPSAYDFPLPGPTAFPVESGPPSGVSKAGRRLASARNAESGAIENADAWSDVHRCYLNSVRFVDALVARLLEALDSTGRRENTIIVFTADHGFHLGDQGHFGKQTLWPAATRVPLLIATPSGLPQGTVCSSTVGTLDLSATLLDLCRLPPPERGQSHSLLEPCTRQRPFEPVLVSHSQGSHAVVTGDRICIRYADDSEEALQRADPDGWTPVDPDAADPLREHLPTDPASPVPGRKSYAFDRSRWQWSLKGV